MTPSTRCFSSTWICASAISKFRFRAADVNVGDCGSDRQRDVRHLEGFASMQDAGRWLCRKTLCADRQLEGPSSYAGKDVLSVGIGDRLLLPGLPIARKPHLRGDNGVSILVDDRAEDRARRLLLLPIGRVLPRQDADSRRLG